MSHLEMSLGSTEVRPNCHKYVGPGRLQVLYHHISQVQVHGAHQGHKGVVLVSKAAHLLLVLLLAMPGPVRHILEKLLLVIAVVINYYRDSFRTVLSNLTMRQTATGFARFAHLGDSAVLNTLSTL